MMSAFDLISDLYKDARGFHPSSSFMEAFYDKPHAEQETVWNELCVELADREESERLYHLRSQKSFENRISGMMNDYGNSRQTALRWDIESFDVDVDAAIADHGIPDQEIEHYLYNQGIAFNMFPCYVEEIKSALGL